ncbi:MAG: DegT/DnrJ/EryC1/StrS family aminotransferase [Microthrixaceae bacterium]
MSAIVQVGDPGRAYSELADQLDAAVARVLRSGRYVHGPEHDAFEQEYAAHVGARHGVGVANGTDALELALTALGSGPGREVVTVANAGGYASSAAVATGARPVFADVLADSLLADPADVEALIGPDTAAVVITHLFGHLHPAVVELAELCARRSVPLVEDCAQATGAQRDGRHAGSFGSLATHSFYPTKNLGALGDAGMITTDDPTLAARLRALRHYGWDDHRCSSLARGRNSRLDELQAAVLRVKLRHLDDAVARRRAVVGHYRRACPDRWWAGEEGPAYAAHLAVTRTADRPAFRAAALAAGIATAVHFEHPDPTQPAFAAFARALPTTERACEQVVTLPCHPALTPAEIRAVTEFLEGAP